MRKTNTALNIIAIICTYFLLWGLTFHYSRTIQEEIDSGACTFVPDSSLPFGAQRIDCPKSGSIIISK
jgi:hypothetical protein